VPIVEIGNMKNNTSSVQQEVANNGPIAECLLRGSKPDFSYFEIPQ
jgi:hypothetical protein